MSSFLTLGRRVVEPRQRRAPFLELLHPVSLAAILITLSGCATRSPVLPGLLLGFTRAGPALKPGDGAYEKTLQVRWLGAACYLFQLGDKAIFTDPFLTRHSLARVGLGGSIQSDPVSVSNRLEHLPVPQAMFVGHSHYDHLLDAAECLKQPGWSNVPIYGSASTRNLLAGFAPATTNLWRPVVTNGLWRDVTAGVRYQAVSATHSRQVPLLPLLYDGAVDDPKPKPPRRAGDFKVGDTYAFVFELSNQHAAYTIYFVGAAHRDGQGVPGSAVAPVDVAVLCVPSWKFSTGYPEHLIGHLQPRHIIASHYDNFFQVNAGPDEIVPLADLKGFLIRIQESVTHPAFESIQVPSVGSTLRFNPKSVAP